MTKTILKCLIFFGLSFMYKTAEAQHYCGYDIYQQLMEKDRPGWKAIVDRNFAEAEVIGNQYSDRDVLEVPIVFHVVWKDSVEYVSDSLIYEELKVLNQSFRRQNADTVNLRSVFYPVVADAQIQFRIAEIKRVKTTSLFESTLQSIADGMKFSSKGGSDVTSPDEYLNIWICKIQPINVNGTESPLLGYAFPPIGLSNWPAGSSAPSKSVDGVVVDYRTVGGTGRMFQLDSTRIIPMEGKTMVHEVGHYLGLRHIWGDGFLAQLGIPDCNADDGIADTPLAGIQSMFVCDQNLNHCTEPSDKPNMIENYMDYSTESCQNSFTKLQGAHMRGVLMGVRSGLINSEVATKETKDNNFDLSVFPNPNTGIFGVTITDINQKSKIRLNSLDGKLIYSNEFNGPTTQIELPNLRNGQYLLQVTTDSKRINKMIQVYK